MIFLSTVFGLIVGSFLNVVIHRLPRGESVIKPRSHCPKCNKRIAWYDNIPLFSYLFLRRRCRHCHKSIAFRYFFVELLTGIVSLQAYLYFDQPVLYLTYFCFFLAPLIAVIFIDCQHRIIPDSISLTGIPIGVVIHTLSAPPLWEIKALIDSAVGIFAGGGFLFLVAFAYEKIKKREGLGGGDVKLAAMLGAFFGWQEVLMILLVASVLGSVIGLAVVFLKKNWEYLLPFGPFLALAGYFQLFWGEAILAWYLGLFH